MRFKNPFMVASATPTKDAEYMKKALDAGAGGIVAKSVTFEENMQHYVRPRFTILHKHGWPHVFSNYSCEFLATYSPEKWVKEIKQAQRYAEEADAFLIASIMGLTLKRWRTLAKMMEEAGSHALEMNFGCPHPRELKHKTGTELGQDPSACAEVTETVKGTVGIPVIAKLTPEAVNIVNVARTVKEAGADGLTIMNRYPALDVDLKTGRPLLHSTFAGVGGPWMRPITLKWIAKVAKEIDIPISASNGIWTWRDAVKAIMCGASTVQLCTAILYGVKGLKVVGDFVEGMHKHLDREGYKSLNKIKDLTLGQILPWEETERETLLWAEVIDERCNGCSYCPNWCFYGAVSMVEDKAGKRIAKIDRERCDGCALCVALCPQDAIAMKGKLPIFLGDYS
ncbi:MAG: 4Fe-4S dicluster domain-containing protein [Nitrososphaeria archaeon]|nr:4Fe-4S dicluster domain-containing protein [Nitrososphaeria archaeon]NIN53014.1 4Fe-4S dicluster domain-containing protein [Nitrososphaeria archaeon]NIQ33573.1 4Fe-4S dicluster domain-containing protein [Nitrososphaeria archaeon]